MTKNYIPCSELEYIMLSKTSTLSIVTDEKAFFFEKGFTTKPRVQLKCFNSEEKLNTVNKLKPLMCNILPSNNIYNK